MKAHQMKGSSNENKEHMDFSELEDGGLNHEVIPSVTNRSRFFTDAENTTRVE